jgi:hypothetical protein
MEIWGTGSHDVGLIQSTKAPTHQGGSDVDGVRGLELFDLPAQPRAVRQVQRLIPPHPFNHAGVNPWAN